MTISDRSTLLDAKLLSTLTDFLLSSCYLMFIALYF